MPNYMFTVSPPGGWLGRTVGLAEGMHLHQVTELVLQLKSRTSCTVFEGFVPLGISEGSRFGGRSTGKGTFSSANCDHTVVVCRAN